VLDPGNVVFRRTPAPVSESLRGCLATLLPLLLRITDHPADRVLASRLWRYTLPTHGERAAPTAAPARQRDARQQDIDRLIEYMGENGNRMPEEQFAVLRRVIAKARAAGMRVTAVSVPQPTWHKSGSSYHAAYEAALRAAMRHWSGDPGVRLVDLSSSASDESFRDGSHPRAEAAAAWSAALAEAIKER
jgi:nicotinamidase-related amidase